MNFLFDLPKSNKQLLDDANCSNYFVKQVYNSDEIPPLLRTAHQAFRAKNAFYIFDHFDVFFSVIENASQLQISHSMRAIDILQQTTNSLGQLLDEYLRQDTLDRQNDFLNLIKMVMYLLVGSVRAVDSVLKKNSQGSTGGRKSKKNADEQGPASYDTKRYEVLVQVCNIMQLPIEKLWSMSTIDEDFVNLLCDLAYRSLTHSSSKEKHVNDAIFRILGIAIKQYRHSVAFPIQIVEIMDREESAVIPIANGVRFLNDELGERSSVMSKLLAELVDKMNGNPSQILSKNLSLFITEIGLISPELSLQCLEMAPDLLNVEAYVVRNSLFGIMNSMIVNHLCGEDLSDDQRTLRDECLEDLYNHMNDTNSYVRSKVLQVWNDLKNKNAVPLPWIHPVVNRTVERLEDRTATVRKHAIILLRSYLESNPFSAKLQTDKIHEKLKMEKKKMEEIREKAREQYRNHDETQLFYDEQCAPQLDKIFRAILSDEQRTNTLLADGKNIDTTESSERVQAIRDNLKNRNFDQVAQYIIQLDGKVGHELVWRSMNINEQALYFVTLLKTYLFDDFESACENQESIIVFLEEALQFTTTMTWAVPKLEQMLLSTTLSDVLEAIEFFKMGYLFDIEGTENGMRLMLRLLYITTGQEKNEKGEAVIKAYHSILFGTDASGRAHHLKVVDNLYKFIENITTGEHSAFEQMIKHWVLSDEINIHIINVLFERFTLKLSDTSSDFSRCCLELLILVSNAKPAVAKSNITLITDILNSRRISEDPRIFVGALKLFMNIVQPMDQNGNKINKICGFYQRFEDNDVIASIISTFKTFFFYPKLTDFEAIATQTIDFVYKMCNAPDLLGQGIIHDICKKVNEFSQKRAERMAETADCDVGSTQPTEIYIPKYVLPRIIYMFGYIATKELVFLDNDIYLNVKYREELQKKDDDNRTFQSDGSFRNRANGLVSPNAADAQENVYLGATAEDSIADTITNICDNELIGSADGLLHHFVPIVMEILTHPGKYSDQYVQRAAVLTFMRFMAVSSRFCADQIGFLMNILNKTRSTSMKCNIIIGLADLTSRFANTIEPWTPNFFTMLLETDQIVRLTSMKMLSYMILQGIIRVTGQASDMAGCICDDDPEIQNTAKEFFRQLIASKELDFYKILPDIVSRLSSNDAPIVEEKFHRIMKYLVDLIQKDRHMENLVEKLCGRFRTTNTERQWRDAAFCLSLLNHSEKTMKKLLQHLPNYKDKIPYDGIYDCFKAIIANVNKQMLKPELKNLAKELDAKLGKCLKHGQNANVSMDDTATEDDAEILGAVAATVQTTKRRGKENRNSKQFGKSNVTKAKRGKSRRRQLSSSSDDDDFDDDVEVPAQRGRKR